MKQFLLCGVAAFICNAMNAQGIEIDSISCDNYASEALKNVFVEMPDYREVSSGSKFVVTYESGVPAELQGAFEHAVKIWEEVLPMTLPIHITVKTGSIRGNGILSRISFDTCLYESEREGEQLYPLSMIKGVILQEYHSKGTNRFLEDIRDTSIFDNIDISITYNKNKINQFDFSLDGETSLTKYDFVTVAMRDIAIGLGFSTSITADPSNKKIIFGRTRFSPFETLVINAIGTTDPYAAFTKATKGSLNIALKKFGNIEFDTLRVYAPVNWSSSSSLRYLIPDDNPISKLLTYDFGKGYVMRDLSGVNWDDIFYGALDWRKIPTSGSGSGGASHAGTSDDIFPYRGTVNLTFNNNDTANFSRQEQNYSPNQKFQSSSTVTQSKSVSLKSSFPADIYCQQFDAFSPDGPVHMGLSLSVLKKDGTWDCIYKVPYMDNEPISLKIEDLALNYDESEYARGTTGGLRYRLTKCTLNTSIYPGDPTSYTYRTKYFTRDYTPQKAFIKYTPEQSVQNVSKMALSGYDDWFVDVKVGISNLEGTTRVFVEQLDEGEELPFQYEVTDFRKGYFIANLDRECSTTLTVICYNDNGYQRSNTIVIPAIGYNNATRIAALSFDMQNDAIMVKAGDEVVDNCNYSIAPLTVAGRLTERNGMANGAIDISTLADGLYVLTAIDEKSGLQGTFKFRK